MATTLPAMCSSVAAQSAAEASSPAGIGTGTDTAPGTDSVPGTDAVPGTCALAAGATPESAAGVAAGVAGALAGGEANRLCAHSKPPATPASRTALLIAPPGLIGHIQTPA